MKDVWCEWFDAPSNRRGRQKINTLEFCKGTDERGAQFTGIICQFEIRPNNPALKKIRSFLFPATLILLLQSMSAHAQSAAPAQDIAATLQQAEALLGQAKPADAYQLLAPFESQHQNEPRFNYVLGAALLESGKPELAIAAFKRVLAVNPQFAAARLDLGRAYFAIGQYDEAKSAFTTAKYQNPPLSAMQAIDYHLNEIERRGSGSNLSGSTYLSATVGRDGNVSGGLENSRLYIVGVPDPFILDPKNIKAADVYMSYSVGGNVRLALDTDFAAFASADVQRRDNNRLRGLDSMSASVNAGVEKATGASNLKLSATLGRGVLDYANLRRNATGALEWRYNFSRTHQVTLYGQAGYVRYAPQSYQPYDVNQRQVGASWFRASDMEGNPSTSFSTYFGQERAINDLPDGNKRIFGARLGGQIGVARGTVLDSSLGFEQNRFDKEREILFGTDPGVLPQILTRRDQRLDLGLGLTWTPEINWSVRPAFSHTRATSNIPIYEFSRNDFSLSVRRDFR